MADAQLSGEQLAAIQPRVDADSLSHEAIERCAAALIPFVHEWKLPLNPEHLDELAAAVLAHSNTGENWEQIDRAARQQIEEFRQRREPIEQSYRQQVSPKTVKFFGHVVWLTAEQGGRSSGPPHGELRATGFVPPHSADDGLASFWLSGFANGAWRSDAMGWWPLTPNSGAQTVRPGTVVVVTEGARVVAYFHTRELRRDT